MEKEIIQLGNSLAVIIPSPMARQCRFRRGDSVRLKVEDQTLRIDPMSRLKPVKLCGLIRPRGSRLRDFRTARSAIHRAFSKRWKQRISESFKNGE